MVSNEWSINSALPEKNRREENGTHVDKRRVNSENV